jgi:hypothetical protein
LLLKVIITNSENALGYMHIKEHFNLPLRKQVLKILN